MRVAVPRSVEPDLTMFNHLWTSEIAEVIASRAEVRAFFKEHGDSIMRFGRFCRVKAKPIGAGMYRVSAGPED